MFLSILNNLHLPVYAIATDSITKKWKKSMIFFLPKIENKTEVIVRFVDGGGIVDHHCINFLFITAKNANNTPAWIHFDINYGQ